MAITFNPEERRIILDSNFVKAGTIWSRWIDWMATGDNSKYYPALRQAGGDEIGGGLYTPIYIFLINDWRVRPMEANQDLEIDGNLVVEGGGTPVVKTLGNFQVNVKYTVPLQAQGIVISGSSGPSAAEIAAATLALIESSAIIAKEKSVNNAIALAAAKL